VPVALGTQRAMRMRRIISSTATSLAVSYLYALSHKGYDFWDKINSLNAGLILTYSLLALLGAHHILHVSVMRVNVQKMCFDFLHKFISNISHSKKI
jgi:hypothetical protein